MRVLDVKNICCLANIKYMVYIDMYNTKNTSKTFVFFLKNFEILFSGRFSKLGTW